MGLLCRAPPSTLGRANPHGMKLTPPLMLIGALWLGAWALPTAAQYVPQTPHTPKSDAPMWVQLMHRGEASVEEVRAAYEAHYAVHPFEKNRDTQHYKRWLRNVELPAPELSRAYLEAWAARGRVSGVWEEMGPWHYDPEVAMQFQVQSPGACHVYTVEQAPSDHQTVWCGTATAGAWKSSDHGAHWTLMSRDLPLTSVYSIAIHPEDPDRVWLGSGSGQLWRTDVPGPQPMVPGFGVCTCCRRRRARAVCSHQQRPPPHRRRRRNNDPSVGRRIHGVGLSPDRP